MRRARDEALPLSKGLARLTAELRSVNEGLWDSEDRLRLCERQGDFGPAFIELARSVYFQNDRRAALKQRINELLGARAGGPKAYPEYGQEPGDLSGVAEPEGEPILAIGAAPDAKSSNGVSPTAVATKA